VLKKAIANMEGMNQSIEPPNVKYKGIPQTLAMQVGHMNKGLTNVFFRVVRL
jgi:hypothetical protein